MSAKEELAPGTIVRGHGVEITIDKTHSSRAQTRVYAGRASGKRTALKIVHGAIGADARFREAWKAEQGRAAQARSERAVRMVAHGVVLRATDAAGVEQELDAPFVVTEWVDAEDAWAKVARLGAMPAWSASSILDQLVDVLAAAHEAGVVHRDLTAESLWLTPAPPPATEPALRVSFCGVAKVASDVKKNTLAAMDRPLWMAPEQTETDVVLTPATDVWTFGLLTYWLLVGRTFWRSPESDVMSLMREMTYDAIPRASERAHQQGLGARSPHGFDAWFAKAVAKRPRDRFQSIREAHQALIPFIRQAIDVQRNEAIAAAGRPRASSPAAAPQPAATLRASSPEPGRLVASPIVAQPAPLAPAPALAAPSVAAPAPNAASPPKPIGEPLAAGPVSVADPAPAPVTVAAMPLAAEVVRTLVSPVADEKRDVPAPKRVEEPAVVPVRSNNDTLIGAPVIEPAPHSAANTLVGYANPGSPVEGTLTEAPKVEASADTGAPPAPAPKVEYVGALARFAAPTAAPSSPGGHGVAPPTQASAGQPAARSGDRSDLPKPSREPTPMTAAQIAKPRETPEAQRERRRLLIMIASIVGVIVVFGAVGATITYALVDKDDERRERDLEDERSARRKKRGGEGTWSDSASPVPVTSDDPSWGDRDAAVTIVDFVDFESMSSRALESALGEARRRYKPSQLRIVWKSLPEPQHVDGNKAALTGQAVFAVGGSAAFLRFHDDASANTGSLDEISIETWGITAGVKRDDLRKGIVTPTNTRKVAADVELGRKLGERSAGVLYINGLRYELETSTRLFKKIDDALMEAAVETDKGTAAEDLYVTLSRRNFKKRSVDDTDPR